MDTRELDRLEERYNCDREEERNNGDFDTLPDHPVVTWADRELVSIIRRLVTKIEQLEARVEEHEGGGYKKMNYG